MRLGIVLVTSLIVLPGCRGDSSEQVVLRARMLAGLLVEGEFGKVGVRLSPGLRRRLPPAELAQMFRDLRTRAGRIQGIEKVTYEASPAGARGVVALRCEKRKVDLVVVFDRDGKAKQLLFRGLPKPALKQPRAAKSLQRQPSSLKPVAKQPLTGRSIPR